MAWSDVDSFTFMKTIGLPILDIVGSLKLNYKRPTL